MPFNEELHLFAIMNDPCESRLSMACMITTLHENRKYDPACILGVGDHPFLTRKSFVLYRTASQIQIAHFQKMLSAKVFFEKENFSAACFQKIVDGLYASDNTKGTMLRYAREVGI